MTTKEILKELRKDGWMEIGQRGSHLSLKHPIKPGKVTLPAWLKRIAEEHSVNYSRILETALMDYLGLQENTMYKA